MMVKKRQQAWQTVFLLSVALGAASAALEVEHAFGGSGFRPAGKLSGNLLSDMELEWQRPALTSDDMELLEKAAESDGLYSVRVQTAKGTLLSSVPANCLLLRDFNEHVALAAGRDGFVEAFNYDVKSCSSAVAGDAAGSSSGSDSGALGGAVGRPERLSVRVQRPAVGPILSMPELMGEFADVSVDSMDMSGGAGAAAYDPNAKPRAVPAASGGQAAARKGGPPEKDERTWLQKNWLVMAAVGMMVLNMVMKTTAPPPQQGGAPAPAAGAGAAARRG